MVFQIIYKGKYEDDIFIEGRTIEIVKRKTDIEIKKRNWERKNCHSVKVS